MSTEIDKGRALLKAFRDARDAGAPFPCEDEDGYSRWLDAKSSLQDWSVRDGGVAALLAEIDRLRGHLDQTADGVLAIDCEKLYCPKCDGEVRQTYDVCYCDQCVNPDDGGWPNMPPLPLFYSMCLSKPKGI